MKKLQILLFLMLVSVLKVVAQQNTSGNLYFRFDGETVDPKQWYSTTPTSGGIIYEDSYRYKYPCILGLDVDPSLQTLDKSVFTTVPISQLVQYDVMTIQDFCQRCDTLGAAAQNAWLKPYVLAYPNYKIFVVHINQATQTAKIVQVKWTAWQ